MTLQAHNAARDVYTVCEHLPSVGVCWGAGLCLAVSGLEGLAVRHCRLLLSEATVVPP